jgi:RNA polymerase sigma factor (sigma-70 family)
MEGRAQGPGPDRGDVDDQDASEADLVRRSLDGHEPAFDELYRRHAGAVLALLGGLFPRDEHAARDGLQEAFLRVHAGLAGFEAGRPLRPWVLRIARNVGLDILKKKGPLLAEPALLDGMGRATGDAPADALERKETAARLREAVDGLPTEERVVLVLRHELGQRFEEIADVVGCSVRTAKYRMKSALQRIGRRLERPEVRS